MTPPAVEPTRRAPAGLIVLVSVLAALMVAVLGVGAAVSLLPLEPSSPPAAVKWPTGKPKQAMGAARECIGHFFDVDRDTVDEDMQRVLDCSTGKFRSEYEGGKAQVRAAVTENQVRTEPRILAAAVVEAPGNSATVLVAVDARVHNTSTPKGRTVHYRVRVRVSRVGDVWKVSALTFVA